MWPSQIENDPQSQLPGGHNDPWNFFWRENPGIETIVIWKAKIY